eukprot:TRINITY_DN941_c0_g1_i2.p1 TRINITY_DN941_c0_g1~~TRINITY_DN941_c0_g1_i2.p1  ORF type:complete len:239 (+),score=69.77 TRINITY_DN941_c0_g1_i2:82-798(+)
MFTTTRQALLFNPSRRWASQNLASFAEFQSFLTKEKATLERLRNFLPEKPVGGSAGHYAELLFAYRQIYPNYDPSTDVATLRQALGVPAFMAIVSSPSGISKRDEILDKTFKSLNLQPNTITFLKQLDSIKKLPLLGKILPLFESYVERVDPPPVDVKFIVSSEDYLPHVEAFIQRAGAKANVKWAYDPNLGDGLIIETENGQIDASLKNAEQIMNEHLRKIERQFAHRRGAQFEALL